MKTKIEINNNTYKNSVKELPNLCCIRIKTSDLYYLVSKYTLDTNKVVLISLNDGSYNVGMSIVNLYTVENALQYISEGRWEIVDSKITI